ncbi:MAG: HAMP domain-containing sensor histidine kinase, partial [Pseudomonadota bacterium]
LIEAKIKAEEQARIKHKAVEIRDQFVAVLGHDLRNPLAAVEAGARMLAISQQLEPREKTIINEMEKSLKRAHNLIDDVLDLARGKLGGEFVIDWQKGQYIRPVIEHVTNELRAIASEREIVTHLNLDEPVDCAPDRIGQLVSNLLANAINHGAPDQPIVLTGDTARDRLTISVANGGEPIPKSAQAMLFKPFARGRTARTKQGLGLGLFIVKEIAKAHRGKMTVSSTKKETKFTMSMPRTSDFIESS